MIDSTALRGDVHVVTGATGFLGRHFVSRLLRDRPTDTVCCISRSTAEQSARERVLALLDADVRSCADRLVVLEGDITHPACGIKAAQAPEAPGARTFFWHSAASLNWEEGKQAHIFKTNVDGTKNALTAAALLRSSAFFYISTAYTCGSAEGDIGEDGAVMVSKASNFYEASKIEAELLVRSWCAERGMPHLVLRPGIILGSSETFEPCGSYSGLYGFIRELRRFARSLAASGEVARIHCELDARLAWIPVDHCTADLLTCLAWFKEETLTSGAAVHLVSALTPESVTMKELTDHVLMRLDATQKVVFTQARIHDMTPLEQVIDRKLAFYSSYIRSHKRFASRLPQRRPVTREMMNRFIDQEMDLAPPAPAVGP